MTEGKCIFLFEGTRMVIQAEKRAIALNIPYQIVPVPKKYSSECGMCIEIDSSNVNLFSSDLYNFNIIHVVVNRD